jgi:hypothetical protein
MNAQKYGVIGVLIFEDPKRVAPSQSVNFTYPYGIFTTE